MCAAPSFTICSARGHTASGIGPLKTAMTYACLAFVLAYSPPHPTHVFCSMFHVVPGVRAAMLVAIFCTAAWYSVCAASKEGLDCSFCSSCAGSAVDTLVDAPPVLVDAPQPATLVMQTRPNTKPPAIFRSVIGREPPVSVGAAVVLRAAAVVVQVAHCSAIRPSPQPSYTRTYVAGYRFQAGRNP